MVVSIRVEIAVGVRLEEMGLDRVRRREAESSIDFVDGVEWEYALLRAS